MRHLQTQPASVGQSHSGRPARLLAGYLCNLNRGPTAVRGLIVEDIKRFQELGADGYALDLTRALRQFDRAQFKAA